MKYPLPIEEPIVEGMKMTWAPFGEYLGLETIGFNGAEICTAMKWQDWMVGNPQNQSVHGGVITAFMDQTFGAAVFRKTDIEAAVATIELRIDYMRPATPEQDIFCRGLCYRATRQVAFVRGDIFQDDPANPIAHGVGTFMLYASDSTPPMRPFVGGGSNA